VQQNAGKDNDEEEKKEKEGDYLLYLNQPHPA
jgi:hypothetical protein